MLLLLACGESDTRESPLAVDTCPTTDTTTEVAPCACPVGVTPDPYQLVFHTDS